MAGAAYSPHAPPASHYGKEASLNAGRLLGKVVKVDAMMREDQRTARAQRGRDVVRSPPHLKRRQVVEQLGHDDRVVASPWEAARHRQPHRPRAGSGVGERIRHQRSTALGRLGRVEAAGAGGDRGAVRSVAGGQFEHAADRAGAERVEDRTALHRLVMVGEGRPGIGIRCEFGVEIIQCDRPHNSSITNVSHGRLKAATCARVIEKPAGSSVIRPACVR